MFKTTHDWPQPHACPQHRLGRVVLCHNILYMHTNSEILESSVTGSMSLKKTNAGPKGLEWHDFGHAGPPVSHADNLPDAAVTKAENGSIHYLPAGVFVSWYYHAVRLILTLNKYYYRLHWPDHQHISRKGF